jgi:uncharacterized FlaG/YvyC family protein
MAHGVVNKVTTSVLDDKIYCFLPQLFLLCADKIGRRNFMTVSAYQIQNVLRVYSEQLRQGKTLKRYVPSKENPKDKIDISTVGKRTSIIKKLASEVVDKIAYCGPTNDVEASTLKTLEEEYGSKLKIDRDVSTNELVFKVIDNQNNETIEIIPPEEAIFLKQRLEEIAKSRIDNNMFS